MIVDIAASLARQGFGLLAIANAHLDPAHLTSLDVGRERDPARRRAWRSPSPISPRKPWALGSSEEFRSGACHAGPVRDLGRAGRAARPGARGDPGRRSPPNPASLSRAIRAGKQSFEEAGGPRAYFGFPAEATAEEGRSTIESLGAILDEAVQAELGARTGAAHELPRRPGRGGDRRAAGGSAPRPRGRSRPPAARWWSRPGRRDRSSGWPRELAAQRATGPAGRLRRDQRGERAAALPPGRDELGPVAILVNNAGAAASMPLAKTSLEDWNRLMAVNATGAVPLHPGVPPRDAGAAVGPDGQRGLDGRAAPAARYIAAYTAAKHALVGFTRSAAAEVAGTGVTVNAVCPGYVDTEMTTESLDRIVAKTGRSREEALAAALASAGQTPADHRRRGGGGGAGALRRCGRPRPTARRWSSTGESR